MKKVVAFLLVLYASFALSVVADAGWGPSGCAVAQVAPRVVGQTNMTWHPYPGHPSNTALYQGSKLIGYYSFADGFYRRWTGTDWSRPEKAPITPPLGGTSGAPVGHSFGAVVENVNQFGMASFNGAEITEAEAKKILGANLRDDSTAGSVTYVDADKQRREKFVKDVEVEKKRNPRLENVKVQAYDPNAGPTKLMLAPFLLDADNQFRTAGKVTYAQHAPRVGEASAKATRTYGEATQDVIVDALRVIDPEWKPNLPVMPSLPTIPDGLGLLLAAGLVTCGLLAVAVSSRNNS